MKKYFCDRCGLEVMSFFNNEHGYNHLCFDCKVVLDALGAWDIYVKQATKRLGGGEA